MKTQNQCFSLPSKPNILFHLSHETGEVLFYADRIRDIPAAWFSKSFWQQMPRRDHDRNATATEKAAAAET